MYLKSWAQSSSSPDQIADTIKGAILSASALIIWAAHTFAHVELGSPDITGLAIQLGGGAGALWLIYGLIKKAFMRVATV